MWKMWKNETFTMDKDDKYTRIHLINKCIMDAIEHFKSVPKDTDMDDFIHTYQMYMVEKKISNFLGFQMKSIIYFETHLHLLKMYLSTISNLTKYQRYILTNYVGRLQFTIKMYHSGTTETDVEFRRVLVLFIQYVNNDIVYNQYVSDKEYEYWFKVVFNTLMAEKHNMGLSIILLQLLEVILTYFNTNGTANYICRYNCFQRMFEKQCLNLPNLVDYCINMYSQHHQNINWPVFVDKVLVLTHVGMGFYKIHLTSTLILYDSNLLKMMFLFLNDDDSSELFGEILYLTRYILTENVIDYNPQLASVLFTPYNLSVLSTIPRLFDDLDTRQDVQMHILDIFTCLINETDTPVERATIESICFNMDIYTNIEYMYSYYLFMSSIVPFYPDIDYNIAQIRTTIEYIVDEDETPVYLCEQFLEFLLDVFLCSKNNGIFPCIGKQASIFSSLVDNYQFLTITLKSRMLMALVVLEFMKIGNLYHHLGYPQILLNSGYLDIEHEDDNIYNQLIIHKIKYNYVYTTLFDKCKMWINEHAYHFDPSDLKEIDEFLN